MPSDALIGILTGLGRANSAQQKNIFDQQLKQQEELAQYWERLATSPDATPEAKEQWHHNAFAIRMAPPGKIPKELTKLDLTVAPKMGQSWLGGQTSRDVTPQQAPIPADLEGGLSLQQIQQGAVPELDQKVQSVRQPESQPQQASMPTPPPNMRRSPFISAQEKMAQAIQLLKAQTDIRNQGELALAKEKSELAYKRPISVPGGGLYDPETEKWLREPQVKPEKPPLDREIDTFTSADGFRVTTYQRPDGSTYERKSAAKVQPPASTQINVGSTPDNVAYIADQVDNDPTGTMMARLVGRDQKLRMQVVEELRKRDSDLRILTASTRQLGETAHELMPNFDKAINMLNSKTLQNKLGAIGSRWQEFLAGKVGIGDPEFDQLRTFVSLLQTGTARAHVGARGSAALQTKFENLFNSNKMDVSTLRDTLTATKDFLKTYENAVYGKGSSNKPTVKFGDLPK